VDSSVLVELLVGELDDVAATVGGRLEGLTDDEYFWQPVSGYCWTVRPRDTAETSLANGCGAWVVDYDLPEPSPAPFTTIAWQLMHCYLQNEVDHDRFFGDRALGRLWDDVEVASDAGTALTRWRGSLTRIREFVVLASEPELVRVHEDPVRGLTRPAWSYVQLLARENRHHGAIACVLRDLYAGMAPH
jgi:hypothetical protein